MEHKDKVPKDSTAKVQLESLDENTVYYEDFNSGPSVKKKQWGPSIYHSWYWLLYFQRCETPFKVWRSRQKSHGPAFETDLSFSWESSRVRRMVSSDCDCIFTFVWLNSGYQNQGWRGAFEPRPMVLLSLITSSYVSKTRSFRIRGGKKKAKPHAIIDVWKKVTWFSRGLDGLDAPLYALDIFPSFDIIWNILTCCYII